MDIDIEMLVVAHKEGLTDRSIAKRLGCHHGTVAIHRRKLGLLPNGTTRQPLQIVAHNRARCSKCQQVKGLRQFISNRKGQKYEYKISYCHDCRKQVLRKNLNKSIESFLGNNANRLRLRAQRLGRPHNITKAHLIERFYQQAGKCFYTDELLDWGVGKGARRNGLSVGCIIPERGYTVGNVVLCTYKINSVKSDLSLAEIQRWMPAWFARISEFFEQAQGKGSEATVLIHS